MSFDVYEFHVDEKGRRIGKLIELCETLDDCFDVLHKRGHKVKGVTLRDANKECENTPLSKTKTRFDIVFLGHTDVPSVAVQSKYFEEDNLSPSPFRPMPGSQFYLIGDNDGHITYEEFCKHHTSWSRRNIVRKIFHPGNSLTIAFILTAVGIGVAGFGIACPPALALVALGFAAFSAISAIGYAIDWVKRDWSVYLIRAENLGRETSLGDYLEYCAARLQAWSILHPVQTGFMIAGAVLLLGALIITAGYFIAPAVFGFMALGALGGAIGATTGFFGATLSSVPVLASIFAGAALVIGPVNILDTFRRFISGIWSNNDTKESNLLEDRSNDRFRSEESNEWNNYGYVDEFNKQDPTYIDVLYRSKKQPEEYKKKTEYAFGGDNNEEEVDDMLKLDS